MKTKRLVSMLLLIAFIMVTLAPLSVINNNITVEAQKREFNNSQKKIAKTITEICTKEWEKYGVLPSMCIAQAFIESTLGKNRISSTNYNFWGIKSKIKGRKYAYYSTLEEGVYAYMETINNGYYKGAPFEKDYKKMISKILAGGYCYPAGHYYDNIMWTYDAYDLQKYDKELFKYLKEKERKEKEEREAAKRRKHHNKTFTLVYDPTVPDYTVAADEDIILPQGALYWFNDDLSITHLCDVVGGASHIKGRKLHMNIKEYDGLEVKIIVYEDAKG